MGEMENKRLDSQTTPPRRTLNLGLIAVLSVATFAAALYGWRYLQDSGNTSEQQVPSAPVTLAPTGKDARVPTNGGPSWKEIDDPSKDGWDTEAFARQANKQLKVLGHLLAHADGMNAGDVVNLITEDFACGPLRPPNLATVFDDQHLKIDRATTASSRQEFGEQSPSEVELSNRGASGLIEALHAVVDPLKDSTDVRFKFKVFRVVSAENEVSTRQYFSISGHTKSGTVEQHATWDIGWDRGVGESPPRMRWIRVEEFEQTESRQPSGALFADCTESVLGGNRSYADQFLHGLNHWFDRIQDQGSDVLRGNPGLAVGDVNGDGLDDLYVCQETGLPNRLYIQNRDGSASDESASWGVDWLQSSRSALLVDLDNDSDQDLVVAILGGVVVAENKGQGRFHLRDVLETSDDMMSLSSVDYDMDGRLDIYVCAYYRDNKLGSNDRGGLAGASTNFEVHDANNGEKNILFRNQMSADGTWQFADVTEEVGLNANNHRFSLAASWDDIDNDGDLDLYVANDFGRDHLYRNDLIHSSPSETVRQFVDISDTAHIEDSASGMSTTWGDYDRDGWMDILVSNMWSSAGKRIAYQNKFRPETPPRNQAAFPASSARQHAAAKSGRRDF